MSLHLTAPAETKATPRMVRLPKSMMPMITEYAEAKRTKKEADATSRSADLTVKAHRKSLISAMNGSITAVCEHVVLAFKKSADSEPSLTLTNGMKVPWSTVSAVIVGNKHFTKDEILSLYGGRQGPEDVEVTGV